MHADCKLGPYCGDATRTRATKTATTAATTTRTARRRGCGPGCKLPARCGDMLVQTEYGEQCDDGANNDGRYTGCTAHCQRAGYCGDGKTQSPQEQCDDGANDGTYGTCGDPSMPLPNCGSSPRCGDGVVQDAYGEQCEPAVSNDPTCTVGLPPARHLRRRFFDIAKGGNAPIAERGARTHRGALRDREDDPR